MCDDAGIYVMAETNLESHGSWQKLGAVEPSVNIPGSISQWREVVVDRARTNYETFKNHTSILSGHLEMNPMQVMILRL